MSKSFVLNFDENYYPNPQENIRDSLFNQYERVMVESIITSFGLDFLIKDQYGGDVDTIHNVREIGKENSEMYYKNKDNESNYNNREKYNYDDYHDKNNFFSEKKREYKENYKTGNLKNDYLEKKISSDEGYATEHVISAHEVSNDRGRVLSGIKGEDLANCESNLCAIDKNTNSRKKDLSIDEFIEKNKQKYTKKELNKMKRKDEIARKDYERKLFMTYYSSPNFLKDTAFSSGKIGLKMGIRQVLGLVFTEIWFEVKKEFRKVENNFDMKDFLENIAKGIKKGLENAMVKYKELFKKFKEGLVAGIFSSLTTTFCNIFFTTAKNIVRIIRQIWVSLVQALKILFLNPDNLLFGERMRAVLKIISTAASVVVGTLVSEAVGKIPVIVSLKEIGDIVQVFSGAFVTGIMSCSLLYFLDRNETVNKLVYALNNLPSNKIISYYEEQTRYFEMYAAELMKMNIEEFKNETKNFVIFSKKLEIAETPEKINNILRDVYKNMKISLPWGEGEFDTFMNNKDSVLRFS